MDAHAMRHYLKPIEGLRAWLALWVLVDHVMGFSGYDNDGSLGALPGLLRQGRLAVSLFMIVSGFVIFLLLDKREENYRQFICRRFFRLYPVFIVLFTVAVPLSLLRMWTIDHGHQYLTQFQIDYETAVIQSSWRYWFLLAPLHLVMAHGAVAESVLGGHAMESFLGPAWSISLEWQFYLVAPLAYFLATSSRPNRFILCMVCAGLFVLGRFFAWSDGFLPLHVEYFFVGGASYFAYKRLAPQLPLSPFAPWIFPAAAAGAAGIYLLGGQSAAWIPLCLWLAFFPLLVSGDRAAPAQVAASAFNNPAAQFLGKISYSIYLSHEPVLIVVQAALLCWLPQLGKTAHFWILLAGTVALTIALSALLYRSIEAPGMKLGRKLAGRLAAQSPVVARTDNP